VTDVTDSTDGAADELPRTVLMTAGWVINLAMAEWVIRRAFSDPIAGLVVCVVRYGGCASGMNDDRLRGARATARSRGHRLAVDAGGRTNVTNTS
jgi:hypothetical protein